jgi:effector-binding domain-containing protein
MKILKQILLVALTLVILVALVGFFLPRKVRVERSLVIHAPADVLFQEVNTMKSWPRWAPWFHLDPQMEITYFGPESGKGAGYSWKSTHRKVGNGQVMIAASGGDSVLVNMEFMGHGTAVASYKFNPEGSGTKVSWTMENDMGINPFTRYFGLMLDKMVGPDFEKGLHNLDSVSCLGKQSLSEMPVAPVLMVEMTEVPNQEVMTFRLTSSMDSFSLKFNAMFPVIEKAIAAQGLKPSGPPIAIYHVFSPEKVDFEAGIPVDKKGTTMGVVVAKELHACQAAMATFKGAYSLGMKAAHEQIQDYIKTSRKTMAGPPWEVYLSGPGTENDSTKYITQIFYPVK